MLARWSDWNDIDRTFSMMDELRSRMDQLFGDSSERPTSAAWPRLNLFDTGQALVLKAEVPGLTEKDVQITLNQNIFSLSGERKPDAPEGYSVHRQERAPVRFSRSFPLPCRVDPDKTLASIKNGVLTVTLSKAPEAQPRKITVNVS